jgi:hypothetical protein
MNAIAQQKPVSIQENATRVIEELGLIDLCSEYGELLFTGSYSIDLMTWNDIDMQLVPHPGVDPKEALSKIFDALFKHDAFLKSKMIHFHRGFKPVMPRGLYLGLEFLIEDMGGLWKLDLWILERKDFDQNRDFMQEVSKLLTNPITRHTVLELKKEMMKGESRIPSLGSYTLYQGLLKGNRTKDQLIAYLEQKGRK